MSGRSSFFVLCNLCQIGRYKRRTEKKKLRWRKCLPSRRLQLLSETIPELPSIFRRLYWDVRVNAILSSRDQNGCTYNKPCKNRWCGYIGLYMDRTTVQVDTTKLTRIYQLCKQRKIHAVPSTSVL